MLPIGEVSRVAPGPREMLQDNADAYLYLGPSETLTMEQRIPDLLRQRGYSAEAIEGILYRNWVRFFERAWRAP